MNEYIKFLQYCLDESKSLPESARSIEWMQMMDWAEQQAIVGIIYGGIQRAGKALGMPFDALMEWVGYAQQIEMQNRLLNRKCVDVVRGYQEAGYDCMVLKGQGNALMYPNPMMRMSGDIDVWIYGSKDPRIQGDKDGIIWHVKDRHADAEIRYYHVGYTDGDVEVEAHFMPGIMNNPVYNRRLQQWYKEKADGGWRMVELPEGAGEIPVPTWEFNVIYQMSHLMHHFFDEGIGLRQFVDYYFVLRQIEDPLRLPLYKGRNLENTLKHLGLWKFARAVMYVMREVFALDEQYMIAPVDEKRGKTLLNEIMKGGIFGKYSGLTQHSTGIKYFLKHWRNLHFVREYPSEALCEPIFRTWHFFWRLAHS